MDAFAWLAQYSGDSAREPSHGHSISNSNSLGIAECGGLLEPGVVGIFRPILLVPADIRERLSPAQLKSVVAHELCHVQRRDNMTATIHMIVEALFWFHPLVWWIGARLIDERERACDEDVLRAGTEPQCYVDAILAVCTSYLEPPLPSMPGVTGSNLKRRIQAIMTGHAPASLSVTKKAILAVAAGVALATPVIVGVLSSVPVRAQLPSVPSRVIAQFTRLERPQVRAAASTTRTRA